MQFQDFRNEALPRPAFDMHENLDEVGYVRLDCGVREFHTALEDATREPRETLLR